MNQNRAVHVGIVRAGEPDPVKIAKAISKYISGGVSESTIIVRSIVEDVLKEVSTTGAMYLKNKSDMPGWGSRDRKMSRKIRKGMKDQYLKKTLKEFQ